MAYSFKERFVAPIEAGLGRRDDVRPKRQTIRAHGKRRHAREGEVVQLYYGMRTKMCRLIGVGRCTTVAPIRMSFDHRIKTLRIQIEGERPMAPSQVALFARDDGFASVEDMAAFWKAEHGDDVFAGMLIRWEPIT